MSIMFQESIVKLSKEDRIQIALGLREKCVDCGYIGIAIQRQPKFLQLAGHTIINNMKIYHLYKNAVDEKYRCITCQIKSIMGSSVR